MNVILTGNRSDVGGRSVSAHQDCACDCQCACPTDGTWSREPLPVLSLPAAYYLELTPSCNSRCPGCGNVYAGERPVFQPLGKPLDGVEWGGLIARLASHAQQFKLTGGEPTLHADLGDILLQIDRLGIPFTLFTNGRWAAPRGLIRLLKGLERFDGLLVSLHGPDAATHEPFSGVSGSFDETAVNVRQAAEAGLDVAVSTVIHRSNWNRVAEMLDLALALGARHVVCNRLIGEPVNGVTPTEAQLRAAIGQVELARGQGRPIRFGNCIPQCFETSSSRGCTAGTTFATIDPWGRMRPCNHSSLIAGNVQAEPVPAVWHGEVMGRWRDLVPTDCADCSVFATCHGGCRAQGLLLGQSRDPLIGRTSLLARMRGIGVLSRPELRLYDQLRPVGAFVSRSEDDPDVLLARGSVVPVPPECAQLISMLDGSLTLRQIEQQYTQSAVDWVGLLYREGLVGWRSASSSPAHSA